MTYGGDSLSPADVAILSGNNRANGDDAFGGNWAWILVFLIFALGGFGNNGWGNRGNGGNGNGNGGSAVDGYVLATDFANLERKLDGVNNGICDSTFALNNTMTNGFASLQNTLCQGFSGINQNIVTNGYETRLGTQALQSELADCCCKTQSAIQGVNYNLATQSCDTRNAINTGFNNLMQANCTNTRDIIDNQNANYRALHDEIVANRIEDKNAQITAQQNEINALRLAASQTAQNSFLISQLRPSPIPAYQVANPYCCYNPCSCAC